MEATRVIAGSCECPYSYITFSVYSRWG